MKLYEIAHTYRAQLEQLADADVPPEVVADTLDAIQGDLQDKLRACVAYSLELSILASGASDAAKRMSERSKALESRVKGLQAYVLRTMQDTGIGSVECDEFAAKVAKTPAAVHILDGAEVPTEFIRIKTTHEPDKAALKLALSAGRELPGITLQSGFRLAVR